MDSPTTDESWENEYNDTPFNRWKTKFHINISRHIPSRRHANPALLDLSPTVLVKYGPAVHLSEASALLFLASCAPTIPAPKLHCAFRDDRTGVTYIVMEKLDGRPLRDVWSQMSRDEKDGLLAQLKGLCKELRALEKPAGALQMADGAVCAADGDKLYNHRIGNHGGEGFGPFLDEAAFHLCLGRGPRDVVKLEKKPRTVFTHGNLSMDHILVREGRIVGIVDWGMAGWYPQYWEYTAAMSTHEEMWKDEVGKFLEEGLES